MAITFQKRQKEMKRLEKQKMKEERRAQKKLEKGDKDDSEQGGPPIATESELADLRAGLDLRK
jgi:hypothetical protein